MELWTPEHTRTLLPALGVMILIAVILRVTIGKKDLKIRMIPFQILTCVLLLLELGKQILSFEDGYDLYHLPFHFCSLFIFALPAMAFYKGKHRNLVSGVTAALCTAVFALMLIYPNLIYSDGAIRGFSESFFNMHTVVYHNIVMMQCVLILFLNLHTPTSKKEPVVVLLAVVAFCVVSASMAYILKTNYANFYTCNIPVLEEVRLSILGTLGYVVTQLLYVAIVSALNLVFVFAFYWVYRLARRLVNKKALQTV